MLYLCTEVVEKKGDCTCNGLYLWPVEHGPGPGLERSKRAFHLGVRRECVRTQKEQTEFWKRRRDLMRVPSDGKKRGFVGWCHLPAARVGAPLTHCHATALITTPRHKRKGKAALLLFVSKKTKHGKPEPVLASLRPSNKAF